MKIEIAPSEICRLRQVGAGTYRFLDFDSEYPLVNSQYFIKESSLSPQMLVVQISPGQ